MFLKDLALCALRRAGLAHGENVPAERFALAVDFVGSALRTYSECDTITCFSEHRSVTLGNETTIGMPSLRRGVRLHCIAAENELPDLRNYDPNDGSFVIGRDFWHCDDTDFFYTIREDGESYFFDVCLQDEFATTKADIFVKDISKIISMFGEGGELKPVALSKFFGFAGAVYTANVDGHARFKLYVKEPGEHEIVYIRSMVFNENTQIDLPATQEEMIILHAAHALARSSEKKASLKADLDAAVNAATDSSLSYIIPTRSDW